MLWQFGWTSACICVENHQFGFIDIASEVIDVHVNQKTSLTVSPKHFDVSGSFEKLPKEAR